ncbi:MAG TPA: LacI family DNA-binding transcriptional regulator [Vicinamibacteria bacterium]|nr:LacI family DNA-binding transcriptional regulator [Vicinamibacteria bacterium]
MGAHNDRAGKRASHVTIRSIAAMAQVSTGTVSKVLNDAPGVGPETRRRIRKLIRDLNFHPDASAQSLAGRPTYNIGMVIPHTGSYSMASAYWPILLTSITDQAAARNRNVLLSTARSEEDVDSAYRSILRGRRVDGLIVGAEQLGARQLGELLLKEFPFVAVGKGAMLTPYWVDVDNAGGAAAMTRHLVDLGHRRIAMLAGPHDFPAVKERVDGFTAVMTEAGLEPCVQHCAYHTEAAGDQAAEQLRKLLCSSSQPLALFVAAGDLVMPALRVAAELGREIPSDLALVSFDDHPFFDHFSPAITAVSQPIHELGSAATELLFAVMDGLEPEPPSRVLPTRLVVRASCGAVQPTNATSATHA